MTLYYVWMSMWHALFLTLRAYGGMSMWHALLNIRAYGNEHVACSLTWAERCWQILIFARFEKKDIEFLNFFHEIEMWTLFSRGTIKGYFGSALVTLELNILNDGAVLLIWNGICDNYSVYKVYRIRSGMWMARAYILKWVW